MDLFRNAIKLPGPPEDFALKTMQEAIRPQKETKLIQDENQLLENMMRTLIQELVTSAVESGVKIMLYGQSIDDADNQQGQIPRLLDIVLYLCEKEHIEGGMIFQLLEDLTEMSTMRNCEDIFGYIESKQDILGKPELFTRGKLVMLRTCNQLLRRLSKANDVVFCGRIIMFLSHFFPLSERSAVNIKGVFNTSNETKYEKEAIGGTSLDFNFYKIFWSLQEYFSNPSSISKWQKFASSLMTVLSTFEGQPLTEDEGSAINLDDEAVTFNIKYLTSTKLMGLELKDPNFRRHILVQCLILFDYLKAPGKADKDLPSETMKEEIMKCEERVKKLLEVTPPKGREFLKSIEHILERERNWVWWKRDGCPPFEKQPLEKKSRHDVAKKGRPRWRMGNKELYQLWRWADQNPNTLMDPQRVRIPDINEYWKPLADDSKVSFVQQSALKVQQMDESAGIEAEYHHKNNRVYCWKGLRFSARQDLEGFSRFTEHGIEGVVPLELLTPEVRSKYQAKPAEKTKRAKKEDTKNTNQTEERQTTTASQMDVEGRKGDTDTAMPLLDADATSNLPSGSPTSPEDHQKHSSDTEIGQDGPMEAEVDADAETETEIDAETGMIDGEIDPEVDLETVG